MIIAAISYKGGVGKTTTAIHQRDQVESAQRRHGPVLLGRHPRPNDKYIRIDTGGNPTDDDFKALASSCDLLIIPAVPESVRPENAGTRRSGSRMPEACRRRNLSRCPPG